MSVISEYQFSNSWEANPKGSFRSDGHVRMPPVLFDSNYS